MVSWVEINKSALRHNIRELLHLIGDHTRLIAVVKANAYGHGSVETSRLFIEEGADMLAVTRLDEAIPLREANIIAPILLMSPLLPDECESAVENGVTSCVNTIEDAERLSEAATKLKKNAPVQLKINTGMGRLGVEADIAVETAKQIQALPNLELTGAFTHFASAAERDPTLMHRQYALFQPLIQQISYAAKLPVQNFHCANSAAILRFPSMRLSCVRPGTILYGQFPSQMAAESAVTQHLTLRDGFSVKARIIALKNIKRGQTVGYGPEWKATRASRIATIAIGYYDGLSLEPNTRTASYAETKRATQIATKRALQWYGVKGEESFRTVRLHGEKALIIGRIAMQQCSIDVTHIPQAQIGDAVSLTMRRLCASPLLPRVYVED